MINVLVVDDSPVVRDFLTHLMESDPELHVIGTASNGEEAVEAVQRLKPDLVTMDVQMPRLNGFEATRLIMETTPVPIIIVTGSVDPKEEATIFRTIEAGALTVLAKPEGVGHPDHERSAREFVKIAKLMAEVRVVRKWPRYAPIEKPQPTEPAEAEERERFARIVAIGASLGGPVVIQHILAGLPRDYPFPVLIVQHMSMGFMAGFAEWLAKSSAIPVKVATQGELIHGGCAYVAPDGSNMGAEGDMRISLRSCSSKDGLCPSVSHLFRSIADNYGKDGVGVLLTGMGRDGAEELKMIRERGGTTIAQDSKSSIVNGMPGEADKIHAATHVLPPDRIIEMLKGLGGGR